MYGIQAQLAETFVDDVFSGRLVSTVVCLECGNVSEEKKTLKSLIIWYDHFLIVLHNS